MVASYGVITQSVIQSLIIVCLPKILHDKHGMPYVSNHYLHYFKSFFYIEQIHAFFNERAQVGDVYSNQ